MKLQRIGIIAVSAALLLIQNASAQTITIESWEGTLGGFAVPPSYNLQTNAGGFGPVTTAFTTSPGVTHGTNSLAITGTGTGGPNYGHLLAGTPSLGLTALLGTADSLSLDINTPGSSFGFFLQFQFVINNADTGFAALNGYDGTGIGAQTTLTVPISAALRSILAGSANTSEIIIQVGGGNSPGNETMYLDYLRVHTIPEPSTFALLGLGVLSLFFAVRRRVR